MDPKTLTERMAGLEKEHASLQDRLAAGTAAFGTRGAYEDGARRLNFLNGLMPQIHERSKVIRDLKSSEELLAGPDKEFHELAAADKKELTARLEELDRLLVRALLPRDKHADSNLYFEVRAGAGGDEAALFAAEMVRMYTRFAQIKGWKVQLVDSSATGLKGIKAATLYIQAPGAYSQLKFEAGVHRVQRVPATEAAGRIHTSTVTVAVMPEVEDVEVTIDPKDLRIDTYRAGGAGGQNVNKVETAVRITHIPTNTVTQCQEERSQGQNRVKAMNMMRAKLATVAREAHEAEQSDVRRLQVGSGERSEKIRTYNFPQDRLTDHRIGASFHNLPSIMEGNLDDLISTLVAEEEKRLLEAGI